MSHSPKATTAKATNSFAQATCVGQGLVMHLAASPTATAQRQMPRDHRATLMMVRLFRASERGS